MSYLHKFVNAMNQQRELLVTIIGIIFSIYYWEWWLGNYRNQKRAKANGESISRESDLRAKMQLFFFFTLDFRFIGF